MAIESLEHWDGSEGVRIPRAQDFLVLHGSTGFRCCLDPQPWRVMPTLGWWTSPTVGSHPSVDFPKVPFASLCCMLLSTDPAARLIFPGGAGKAELDGKSFFKLCEAPCVKMRWAGEHRGLYWGFDPSTKVTKGWSVFRLQSKKLLDV